jgi:hypothetical protein
MLWVCVGVGVAVSFTQIACDGDRAAALAIRSGFLGLPMLRKAF